MASEKGKFIVLEGIDGAGTTTQAERLRTWLEERGITALVTREPSDGPAGTLIRNALRGRIQLPAAAGGGPLPKETIALLFAADRVDHLQSEILPALERGMWVISDRYVHSSIAYQGTLIDIDWVARINRYAVAADLTLFLRVSAKVAMERIGKARLGKDLFETRELLERIATGYHTFYRKQGQDVVTIDGEVPLASVTDAVQHAVAHAFPAALQ